MQLESLQSVCDKVGWNSGSPYNEKVEIPSEDPSDLDIDSDWADKPDNGLHSVTLSIAWRAGLNKVPQSWSESRHCKHQSWEPEMTHLYDAILAFNCHGPPSTLDPLNASRSQLLKSFSLMCIDLTSKSVLAMISCFHDILTQYQLRVPGHSCSPTKERL